MASFLNLFGGFRPEELGDLAESFLDQVGLPMVDQADKIFGATLVICHGQVVSSLLLGQFVSCRATKTRLSRSTARPLPSPRNVLFHY